MASDKAMAAQMGEALGGAPGEIAIRPMFGGFGVYAHEKIIGLICGDHLYLKANEPAKALLTARDQLHPDHAYEGSGDFFRIDELDDPPFLRELAEASYQALPMQKPRKKKAK